METEKLIAVSDKIGVVCLLLLFALGLVRKWWVIGWQYAEKAKESEEWKAMALEGKQMTKDALDLILPALRAKANPKDDS